MCWKRVGCRARQSVFQQAGEVTQQEVKGSQRLVVRNWESSWEACASRMWQACLSVDVWIGSVDSGRWKTEVGGVVAG